MIYQLFLSTFIYTAFKALQQKNVAHSNYLPVLPVSFAMAACEVFTVYTVATSGFQISSIAAVGLGGGLGAMLAMYLHDKYFRPRCKEVDLSTRMCSCGGVMEQLIDLLSDPLERTGWICLKCNCRKKAIGRERTVTGLVKGVR